MYCGRIVELGDNADVREAHPRLPRPAGGGGIPDPDIPPAPGGGGSIPTPPAPPPGCSFIPAAPSPERGLCI